MKKDVKNLIEGFNRFYQEQLETIEIKIYDNKIKDKIIPLIIRNILGEIYWIIKRIKRKEVMKENYEKLNLLNLKKRR